MLRRLASWELIAADVHSKSIWKDLFNVGRALECQIVKTDQYTILCDLQILFDVIGSLLDGQAVGVERVFRRIRGGAAMCNENLFARLPQCRWGCPRDLD